MKKVVFTESDLELVARLSATMSVEQIAGYFGISKTTYYEVAKRQPELLERYQQGRARRIGQYAALVHQYILEGDKEMLRFYLRTQAGWNEKNEPQDTQELPPINIILST